MEDSQNGGWVLPARALAPTLGVGKATCPVGHGPRLCSDLSSLAGHRPALSRAGSSRSTPDPSYSHHSSYCADWSGQPQPFSQRSLWHHVHLCVPPAPVQTVQKDTESVLGVPPNYTSCPQIPSPPIQPSNVPTPSQNLEIIPKTLSALITFRRDVCRSSMTSSQPTSPAFPQGLLLSPSFPTP